jgi:hypothetical protein
MDRNSTPPWVKIPLRSLHIPAPVYQDNNPPKHSSYYGRQKPLCVGVLSLSRICKDNRTARAVPSASRSTHRLHCSLMRLYFAQLSQMNVAVRADERIHRKGNVTVTEIADDGSP